MTVKETTKTKNPTWTRSKSINDEFGVFVSADTKQQIVLGAGCEIVSPVQAAFHVPATNDRVVVAAGTITPHTKTGPGDVLYL